MFIYDLICLEDDIFSHFRIKIYLSERQGRLEKMNDYKQGISKGHLIELGAMSLLICMSVIINLCFSNVPIRASISPLDVEVGSPIRYSDSTYNASDVLWEFANGDTSNDKKGFYTFKESGIYQVRLIVNREKKQCFFVNVRECKFLKNNNLIKIKAPMKVLQNDSVLFMADGDSDNWSWEFGESGKVDSHERNPIHVYSKAGVYEVKLMAANMMCPVVHRIEVVPLCSLPPEDPEVKAREDIQKRLQQIIDEKNVFNKNYEYLLSKYLGKIPNVPVLINGTNENDFSSYCYGLKIKGKQRSTIIIDVDLERDNKGRIKRLLVTQVPYD